MSFVATAFNFSIPRTNQRSLNNNSSQNNSNSIAINPSQIQPVPILFIRMKILLCRDSRLSSANKWKLQQLCSFIRCLLIPKNQLKFVDRSIQMLDKFDQIYDLWKRCNNLVISWILKFVSPSIFETIVYTDLAYDAWREL